MPVFVSRNTIKLPASASAVNDYYNGHYITLTRTDSVGRQTNQYKEIVDYDGATRIATIGGLWDTNFVPGVGDTYKITPKFTDLRVSINPAIQTMDYVTSRTYGRGLDPIKDLELTSWLNSARKCDTRSDIYVKFTGTAPAIGDIYRLGGDSSLWQGKVAEITGNYIRFTEIIGKLAYAWNNWRTFVLGQLVHTVDNRLYEVTSTGTKTTKPTHTTGTVNGLQYLASKSITKLSGSGPASIPIYTDGNPVRFEKNGVPISGYTLYDSDGVDYFRYLGWDTNDQRSVTRHQTNISVDTSLPLFDNTNSMLQHFGGILRYSGDKYVLEVEEADGFISTNSAIEPRNITSDDIIGRINIQDNGIKDAYNSLTVSFADPANKFEPKNISFFNSEYLKSDRNVPKKGNITIPGITNYYNARLLADKYLTRSRFGLNISMNLRPKGILLLPGKVIQLQYPRYGWVSKKFRIENLTHNDDTTVDIVATEYDDSFYVISNIQRSLGSGLAGDTAITTISAPVNLKTTNDAAGNELIGAIQLTWQDTPDALSPKVFTEVYASLSPQILVNISSISGGQTFTTATNPHNLKVGQVVKFLMSTNGLVAQFPYYIKTTPAANTFTLSQEKNGTTVTGLIDGSPTLVMSTANIIGIVSPPTNSWVDRDVFDLTGNRVEKYYWVRYKIND